MKDYTNGQLNDIHAANRLMEMANANLGINDGATTEATNVSMTLHCLRKAVEHLENVVSAEFKQRASGIMAQHDRMVEAMKVGE